MEYIDHAIYCRGQSEIYDTPVRIIQNQIKSKSRRQAADETEIFKSIGRLLKNYGGKSLHLFPIISIKGLPGFVEEDIEEVYEEEINVAS